MKLKGVKPSSNVEDLRDNDGWKNLKQNASSLSNSLSAGVTESARAIRNVYKNLRGYKEDPNKVKHIMDGIK